MTFYLSLAGLVVLLYRLQPWRTKKTFAPLAAWPLVSILVPCRNEEKNLPPLLTSLAALDYPAFEIIVVDDQSTDQTAAVASRFESVRVIRAADKPKDWCGKNWACWSGVSEAKGELFLFTDADTIHNPDSLKKAVSHFVETRGELMTAPLFHSCRKVWEKFLGTFQLLPFIATAYRQKPSSTRLFAIGQYLLFTRDSYNALYGHSAVKASLAEDADLAHLWLRQGCNYVVYPQADLYSVQMYGSFRDFVSGWKRLLRLGLDRSSLVSILEITLVLHLLTAGFGSGAYFLFFVGLVVIAWAQKQIGRFWLVGALFAPWNAFLFIALTLAAVLDKLSGKEIVWRNRTYPL